MASGQPPIPDERLREAGEDLGSVLVFMKRLWALDQALQSASKRMQARLGITVPQRVAVRIVGRFPGVTASALADILHMHPSTLSGLLRRLEDSGVLKRRTDPKDARCALYGLTPLGQKVDALRAGTVESAVRRVLAEMPADAAAAERVFSALTSELEKSPDDVE